MQFDGSLARRITPRLNLSVKPKSKQVARLISPTVLLFIDDTNALQ